MSSSRLKIEAAKAALKYVEEGMVLGVGTGSTVPTPSTMPSSTYFSAAFAASIFNLDELISNSFC